MIVHREGGCSRGLRLLARAVRRAARAGGARWRMHDADAAEGLRRPTRVGLGRFAHVGGLGVVRGSTWVRRTRTHARLLCIRSRGTRCSGSSCSEAERGVVERGDVYGDGVGGYEAGGLIVAPSVSLKQEGRHRLREEDWTGVMALVRAKVG